MQKYPIKSTITTLDHVLAGRLTEMIEALAVSMALQGTHVRARDPSAGKIHRGQARGRTDEAAPSNQRQPEA